MNNSGKDKDIYSLFANAHETEFMSTDSPNEHVLGSAQTHDIINDDLSTEASESSSNETTSSDEDEIPHDQDIITTEAIDLSTLAPEPVVPFQKYCCLTYAPHLESRTVYVIVSGCFDTFLEAEEFSRVLHQRDPRWNRSVGESGRPLPIPLDRRLFSENPILRGVDVPVVPFNIISETVHADEQDNQEEQADVLELMQSPEQDLEHVSPEHGSLIEENDNDAHDTSEHSSDTGISVSDSSCITCLSKGRSALFLPCRHLTFCVDCARIQTAISNLCPICRSPIKEVMNVFL